MARIVVTGGAGFVGSHLWELRQVVGDRGGGNHEGIRPASRAPDIAAVPADPTPGQPVRMGPGHRVVHRDHQVSAAAGSRWRQRCRGVHGVTPGPQCDARVPGRDERFAGQWHPVWPLDSGNHRRRGVGVPGYRAAHRPAGRGGGGQCRGELPGVPPGPPRHRREQLLQQHHQLGHAPQCGTSTYCGTGTVTPRVTRANHGSRGHLARPRSDRALSGRVGRSNLPAPGAGGRQCLG